MWDAKTTLGCLYLTLTHIITVPFIFLAHITVPPKPLLLMVFPTTISKI